MRNQTNHVSYSLLLGGCGMGSVLGGVLFVAWGYIDRPDISENLRVATHVLAFAVPALFLAGVVGVLALCGSRLGVLGWAGIVLALCGLGLSVVGRIANGNTLYVYLAESGFPPYLSNGLFLLFAGMTLVGIATVVTRPLRGVDPLPLAIGVFGWGYTLTDSGAVLEARSVHVGCGLLLGLGWVALGLTLWLAATKQAKE